MTASVSVSAYSNVAHGAFVHEQLLTALPAVANFAYYNYCLTVYIVCCHSVLITGGLHLLDCAEHSETQICIFFLPDSGLTMSSKQFTAMLHVSHSVESCAARHDF